MIAEAASIMIRSFWGAGISAAAQSVVEVVRDPRILNNPNEHTSWRQYKWSPTLPAAHQPQQLPQAQQTSTVSAYARPSTTPTTYTRASAAYYPPAVTNTAQKPPATRVDYDQYTL
jgi:hypothetical protein